MRGSGAAVMPITLRRALARMEPNAPVDVQEIAIEPPGPITITS
jgi:hypothetical protein